LSVVDKEKIEFTVNAIKINKDMVYDLTRLMEEESKKIPEEEHAQLTYTVYFDKNEERETSSADKFTRYSDDKRVRGLRIWLYSTTKKMYVHIQDYKIGGDISTENSSDENWVIGMKTRLSAIFDQYKAIRSGLTSARLIIVSLLISVALSFVLTLMIDKVTKLEYVNFIGYVMLWTFSLVWGFYYLLEWLFPKLETEYMKE
jgi:hypothetical protein